MLYPSNPCLRLLPEKAILDSDAILDAIKDCPFTYRGFKLPAAVLKRGGEFCTLVFLQAKKGRGGEMLQYIKKVHTEADEDEVHLDIFSHRAMRGMSKEDSDAFCVVVEYDNPEAFMRHYKGEALRNFYRADFLELPPKLSFCWDVEDT